MAEVFVQFQDPVRLPQGGAYTARACGRRMEGETRWEGWIEFVPADGSAPLRTPRETVQPNREHLSYWATGLSVAYLEGALARALGPSRVFVVEPHTSSPAFSGPAPDALRAVVSPPIEPPHAVLDPFHVYAQGEDVLRRELNALDDSHLRNIIRAYRLAPESSAQLASRTALIDIILSATRERSI
jgi:hypothetical protein